MYSIGEFSKINKITPKTLRHYDRIGLLKPANTDQWTGYRYYSVGQMPVIRQILLLRDLGFSLADIAALLAEPERLQHQLSQRQEEIRQQILAEQTRLERVGRYLDQITGDPLMNLDVQIKPLPEVTVASMRTRVRNYDEFFTVVPEMGQYMNSVGAECSEPAYCFNIYHDGEYRDHDIDVEICEAVVSAKTDSEKVRFKRMEGADTAACLMHVGPYSTIADSYNLLYQWLEQQGHRVTGNPRESFIDGIWNTDDPEHWRTEIQIPITLSQSLTQ